MFNLLKNFLAAESETKSDSTTSLPNSSSPDSWEAQVTRADTLWEQGKLSEALAIYSLAIEKNPKSLAIQQRLAERLKHQGDLATAYEKVATSLKNQGNIEQAANYYRQAINIKALTGNTKEQLLRSSVFQSKKPPIPLASLKETAFSFQPLTNANNSLALTTSSSNTADFCSVEVEADDRGIPSFSKNLKTINSEQAMGIDWETAHVYLQKALDHLEKKEWEQTAIACKQATQIMPSMAEAYKIWGNALQRMGKTAEAMFCYTKAVEIKPNLAEVYAGIAEIYAQQQKWHQAIKHYQKAIIIRPSVEVYLSIADIWQQLGDSGKAELNKYQAQKLESSSAATFNSKPFHSNVTSKTATPSNSSGHSIAAYRRIAQKLEQQQKWQQAAQYYRKALDASLAQQVLTPVVVEDQDSIKLDSLEKIPENPHNETQQTRLINQESQRLLRPQDDVKSHQFKSPIFDTNTEKDNRRHKLDNTRQDKTNPSVTEDQLDKAIKRYHKQSKLQPNSAMIHTNLGGLYQRKGKLQHAISCYRKAIKINPRYAQAHLNLARILLRVGKQQEFIKEMQLALALQPKIGSAIDRFYLGNGLIDQGQQQQAISCYYQAILLEPRFIQPYHRLSEVLSQQGKHQEAIRYLEEIINHHPEDTESYYFLGQQLEIQQKWDGAVKAYSQVLQLEPQFPEASQKLNHALAEKLKLNQKLKKLNSKSSNQKSS
ncbi:tetratricopeptide repeat protein [Pleurocapsa sp. PCC 7319]|uniref:tetratricopeptide repeat protein n=1 Tax=Pleurocapsa sp. PCC 7319 TaxID=118161 RepID=UPI000349F57A|nr:tetratricopeptide repeat protein [Pleurocapsa sp. PCC 7319]